MFKFIALQSIFLLLSICSFSQTGNTKFVNPTSLALDTLKIQRLVSNREKVSNIYKVVKQLEDSCTNDLEKAYGIYTFIAGNFTYDLNRAKQILRNEIKQELYTSQVMKGKKGVCGDFSSLFKLMADTLHLPCFRVDGYALSGRLFHPVKQKRINHAWNIIRVDGKWYPVDVTWGIQQYTKKELNHPHIWYMFLMQNSKWFSLTHLPIDTDFQMYTNKITFKDFKHAKWFRKDSIRDSIGITEDINNRYKLSYLENTLKTAENAVISNPSIKCISIKSVIVPLSKLIDKKTKYREKITEEDIELAKEMYKGLIEINEKNKGKGYKKAIRYCNAKLLEIDKLEHKLFPKKFKSN